MSSEQYRANLEAVYGDLADPVKRPEIPTGATPASTLFGMIGKGHDVASIDFAARNVATRDLIPSLKWAINQGFSSDVEGMLVNIGYREPRDIRQAVIAEVLEQATALAIGASRSFKERPYRGLLQSLEWLFRKGMPASRRLLRIAIRYGDAGVTRMLLERGAPLGADAAEIGELWADAAAPIDRNDEIVSMLRIAITARGVSVDAVDHAYRLKSDGLNPADIRNLPGWYEGPAA
ncbi:hypothetical protein ACQVP2_27160 [Methylobacterium aquaticum]|uniref:hypothetical protein n=1 Tax=Methylobacterium aquaticum TaxID=270351 RepID=UPI003D16B6A0